MPLSRSHDLPVSRPSGLASEAGRQSGQYHKVFLVAHVVPEESLRLRMKMLPFPQPLPVPDDAPFSLSSLVAVARPGPLSLEGRGDAELGIPAFPEGFCP